MMSEPTKQVKDFSRSANKRKEPASGARLAPLAGEVRWRETHRRNTKRHKTIHEIDSWLEG
jgi:hypothetical protein